MKQVKVKRKIETPIYKMSPDEREKYLIERNKYLSELYGYLDDVHVNDIIQYLSIRFKEIYPVLAECSIEPDYAKIKMGGVRFNTNNQISDMIGVMLAMPISPFEELDEKCIVEFGIDGNIDVDQIEEGQYEGSIWPSFNKIYNQCRKALFMKGNVQKVFNNNK